MKKNAPRWPVDYKVEYVYRNVKRKRYVSSFTPVEALEQFHSLTNETAIFDITLYEWNKYKTPAGWVEVDDFS